MLSNNVGWIDYNLVLDNKGGPSYVDYMTTAPVIMSPNYDSFTLTPAYYTLGHLSKFILPGSVRVDVNLGPGSNKVFSLGFVRPDNVTVVTIFNE